jgi:hypothetical protein
MITSSKGDYPATVKLADCEQLVRNLAVVVQ